MTETDARLLANRKRQLSDAALEGLAVMADNGYLLLRDASMHSNGMHLYSPSALTAKPDAEIPFTSPMFDALYKRGYIAQASKAKVEAKLAEVGASLGRKPPYAVDGGKYLAWYAQPYFVTKDGKDALETLRARLHDIRGARQAAEDSPRFLVAGRQASGHYGRMVKKPGAGFLYRIVRETDSRFYIEDVKDSDGVTGKPSGGYDAVVKGGAPNRYVEKEDVYAFDITVAQYAEMRRATDDYDRSTDMAAAQMESELAPIRRRNGERRDQLLAQLEDELREVVRPQPPESSVTRGPR